MKEIYVHVAVYETGSHYGYVPVAKRGVESDFIPVPATLKGLRGNMRKAMAFLQSHGATHYTKASCQGVPGKGYSTQYCYDIYTGYN